MDQMGPHTRARQLLAVPSRSVCSAVTPAGKADGRCWLRRGPPDTAPEGTRISKVPIGRHRQLSEHLGHGEQSESPRCPELSPPSANRQLVSPISDGSGRRDRKRLEGSGAAYLPTVTPAVERKASLRLVAFMSSRTCLVRTVVCPGTSRIGSARGDESRLAL